MSDTKHTPGPWVVDHAVASDDGEPLTYVATPELRGTPGHDYRMGYAQVHVCRVYHSEADAQLIAAAPDLLEALKDLMGCIECDNPSAPELQQTFRLRGFVSNAVNRTKDAIAKAEGR